jgi:hypothetical protein
MLPPTPFCAVDRIMSFFYKAKYAKKKVQPPTSLVDSTYRQQRWWPVGPIFFIRNW